MAQHRPLTLPRLPFGEKLATRETNVNDYADRLSKFNPSLSGYEPAGNPDEFNSKSAAVTINETTLVAGANTPLNMEMGNANTINLLVPFQGHVTLDVDGNTYRYGMNQGAMLLPATGRRGSSTMGGSLIMAISPQRIQQAAQAMLGKDASQVIDLRLQNPRILPLQINKLSFEMSFQHLSGMIDSFYERPDTLAYLGIDDLLHRQAVMMLRPDLFATEEVIVANGRTDNLANRRSLIIALDYIDAHLHERITLTDLERICGASARTLQYAFLERMQCSPLAWIRQRRLEKARTWLLISDPQQNITTIALACGFHSSSNFSAAYKLLYGESPSDTLKRSRHS